MGKGRWPLLAVAVVLVCFAGPSALAETMVEAWSGLLCPRSVSVDRAQMAVFVARAIVTPTTGEEGLAGYTPPETPTFPDVLNTGYGPSGTDPFWAYKHIEYIAEQGITQGYEDGTYRPVVVVARDQMAVYITRAFQLPT